jgi:signal transduction histidine kinase
MEDALDSADVLLAESRDRIRDLRYESIEPASLADALTALGEDFSTPHTWTLEVSTRGVQLELNPITYQDIYAIAKEALVNAFLHSKAAMIKVEIRFEPMRLTLDITDNGIGIHPDILSGVKPTGHWGLAGMQERADRLRAALKIADCPGGGAHLKLVIPGPMAFRHEPSTTLFGSFYRGLLKRPKKSG